LPLLVPLKFSTLWLPGVVAADLIMVVAAVLENTELEQAYL